MVLYIVGLGLGDEKDITVRGLECIKSCTRLYLEFYTSVIGVDVTRLSEYYGIPIVIADRNMVESDSEQIYLEAKSINIGFLVVGDPLCATTHVDLMLRAKEQGVDVQVIHNTSVMGAVASCGLPLYQYGYTVSIPLFEDSWKPSSFYERIRYNRDGGMHTLCLLDIKVKEPDYNSMVSGGKIRYLPPRFMSVNTAIDQLFEVEEEKGEGVITQETLAVGMARLGQQTQKIVFGTLQQLQRVDFGPPLHCLSLCGEIHPLERQILEYYRVKESDYLIEQQVNDVEREDRDECFDM